MITRTTYTKPHYHIPRPYHDPAMYAIKLYKYPHNLPFNQAIDKAYALYSDRSFKYHIPKKYFSKRILKEHIFHYIEAN